MSRCRHIHRSRWSSSYPGRGERFEEDLLVVRQDFRVQLGRAGTFGLVFCKSFVVHRSFLSNGRAPDVGEPGVDDCCARTVQRLDEAVLVERGLGDVEDLGAGVPVGRCDRAKRRIRERVPGMRVRLRVDRDHRPGHGEFRDEIDRRLPAVDQREAGRDAKRLDAFAVVPAETR